MPSARRDSYVRAPRTRTCRAPEDRELVRVLAYALGCTARRAPVADEASAAEDASALVATIRAADRHLERFAALSDEVIAARVGGLLAARVEGRGAGARRERLALELADAVVESLASAKLRG